MGGGVEAKFSGRGSNEHMKPDFNFIKLFNVDFMLFMEKYNCFSGRVKKKVLANL